MKKVSEMASWVGIHKKSHKYRMCDFCGGSGKKGKSVCKGCEGFGVVPMRM